MGAMAPNSGVNGAPWGICFLVVSSHFLCWACQGANECHPSGHQFSQVTWFLRNWEGSFHTEPWYRWKEQNLHFCTQKLCLWPCLHQIFESRPQWVMATVIHQTTDRHEHVADSQLQSSSSTLDQVSMGASIDWGVPYTHGGRSHNCFHVRHVQNQATKAWDCCRSIQYMGDLLCLGLFMWSICNFIYELGREGFLFAVWITCFHVMHYFG